MFKKRLIS